MNVHIHKDRATSRLSQESYFQRRDVPEGHASNVENVESQRRDVP